MDEIDFHTFFTLEIIVKKKMATFLKANELPDYKTLKYLVTVNYLRITRGHCYQYDVGYVNRTMNGNLDIMGAGIMLWRMKKMGLVEYIRVKPGDRTIWNYDLTNKGLSVLDNYRSYFYKIERELTYDLKIQRVKKKKSK